MVNRLLVVMSLAAMAAPAAADTKSWAALKNHVPDKTEILLGVDAKGLDPATPGRMLAVLAAGSPELGRMVDVIKQSCAIDAGRAVSDVAVAIATKGPDKITIAIGLDGLDEVKLIDCAQKVVKAKAPKASITAKPGKLSEYTVGESPRDQTTFYVEWPAKDVLVITNHPDQKDSYAAFDTGKAPQGELASFVAKAQPGGVAWVAASVNDDHLVGAYGSAKGGRGRVTGTLHLVADTDAEATKQTNKANKELGEVLQDKKTPTAIVNLLKSIKLTAKGRDVVLDGNVSEADLTSIPMLLMM
jgi:hypothetical protein